MSSMDHDAVLSQFDLTGRTAVITGGTRVIGLAIAEAFSALGANVVVASRKATISLADEVIFLADGRVADRGTHADLLGRDPAYARLVNAYETGEETGEGTGSHDLPEPAGRGGGER